MLRRTMRAHEAHGTYDAVVVGGGHNGLVAAAYLAGAGWRTLVLERLDHVGGAAVSDQTFPGVDVRLSRYSYLVSLLPDRIVSDLGLDLDLRSRPVASYTPTRRTAERGSTYAGLLVERDPGDDTAASFRSLTGSEDEYAAWTAFGTELARFARAVAPTMTEPLPRGADLRTVVGAELWDALVERPLGELVEERFTDDLVRGVVATDALIGTFSHPHDATLRQNRCFAYHVVGNGTGEWRVPVGGMGAVTAALAGAARRAGAEVRTSAEVTAVDADGTVAEIEYHDETGPRRVGARYVLSGVAPNTLDALLGRTPGAPRPEGAQVKVNMVVDRLPRLRSGVDPAVAFAGTFHLDEGYADLRAAYDEAAAGRIPARLPAELYCHSLTDPSILGPDSRARGRHTLTLFGLQTPARLFDGLDPAAHDRLRDEIVAGYLRALNEHLVEPLEDCLARDADGRPCLEAKSPLDVEADVGLPGGHIFADDLSWPWLDQDDDPDVVGRWGVETGVPNVVLCGSGARRGGGVSGIGGHNAAHAVMERRVR